jgi:hypothetical protein
LEKDDGGGGDRGDDEDEGDDDYYDDNSIEKGYKVALVCMHEQVMLDGVCAMLFCAS